MKMKRSVERFLRALGAVVLTQLPAVIPGIIESIPPEHAVWLVPFINFMFKELRMKFPESKVLKKIPL